MVASRWAKFAGAILPMAPGKVCRKRPLLSEAALGSVDIYRSAMMVAAIFHVAS